VEAEPDTTALHPTWSGLGTFHRYGISRAREVQSLRTQVTLQPDQNGTKGCLPCVDQEFVPGNRLRLLEASIDDLLPQGVDEIAAAYQNIRDMIPTLLPPTKTETA
jgi:hypothetical protein